MSQTLHIESRDAEHTMTLASAVARATRMGDIIGLIGELGAGKTQFVRGLALGLGINPRVVSSPTFVFVQEYEPADTRQAILVHIDAYRLHGSDDLTSIGWADDGRELRDHAVVAVEWADMIGDALGENWLEVRLEHASPGRNVTFTPHGDWAPRMPLLSDLLHNVPAAPEASEEP